MVVGGSGANDFLLKPFEVPELHARVDALVRTKRLHAKLTLTETALRTEHAKLSLIESAHRAEATFREEFLAILAHDLHLEVRPAPPEARRQRSLPRPASQL